MSKKVTIQRCPACGDDPFTITEGELQDAQGVVECDNCGTMRKPVLVDETTEMRLLTQAVSWINIGYNRETIIRFVISEGYSERVAVRITDDSFAMLETRYGELPN